MFLYGHVLEILKPKFTMRPSSIFLIHFQQTNPNIYICIHAYIDMINMTRVISISDDAYNALSDLKENNESFSKVVLKIVAEVKKYSPLEFAGKWKGDKRELDRIFGEIAEERKSIELREAGI